MTERTIQHVARELAGEFYDFVRSAESRSERVQIQQRGRTFLDIDPKLFAKTYPTVKDYISGTKHGRMQRNWITGKIRHVDDGKVYADTPGWMFWYEMARQRCVELLNHPDVNERMKLAITDSIIEDREKQLAKEASGQPLPNIPQRKTLPH